MALSLGIGCKGRTDSTLSKELEELDQHRAALQLEIDAAYKPVGPFGTGTNLSSATNITGRAYPSATLLKQRLANFETQPEALRGMPALKVALARATLLNADQRYKETLALYSTLKTPESDRQLGALLRFAKAEALQGTDEYPAAIVEWRSGLSLSSNNILPMIRLGDCLGAAGDTNAALKVYEDASYMVISRGDDQLQKEDWNGAAREFTHAVTLRKLIADGTTTLEAKERLAAAHAKQGDAHLLGGKWEEAFASYEKEIEILTTLVNQEKQMHLGETLALSISHHGDVILSSGDGATATPYYEKAVELQLLLARGHRRSAILPDLARNYGNWASALLVQARLPEAETNLLKAIEIQESLFKQDGSIEARTALARSLNNHAVVLKLQRNLERAITRIDQAVSLLNESKTSTNANQTPTGDKRARIYSTFGSAEKGLDASIRSSIGTGKLTKELDIVKAIALRNRGYLRLALNQTPGAVDDFKEASEVGRRLRYEQAERDMTEELARSLSALAFTYAAHQNGSYRDSATALRYGKMAVELTEGKSPGPLEALAAAQAEAGNFAEAIQLQGEATKLVPTSKEAAARLDLYKAAKPLRLGVDQK